MDRQAAVDELKRRLGDPAYAGDHEKIQAALNKFPTREIPVGVRNPHLFVDQVDNGRAELIGPEGDTAPAAAEPHFREGHYTDEGDTRSAPPAPAAAPPPGASSEPSGRSRGVMAKILRGTDTAIRLGNHVIDKATGGAYGAVNDLISRGTGVRVGTSPQDDAEFEQQHPLLAGAASGIGYVAPAGVPARAGAAIGRGVDALALALMRRKATSLGGRIAERAATGAVTGAATSGAMAASEHLSRGEPLEDTGHAVLDASASGAAFGGGLGAVGAAGEAGAAAMRRSNPDLKILDDYGFEPSPIPGRPVVRKDQPLMRQLPGVSEPPLTRKAGPGTRAQAAREAADRIVPDMAARSAANNDRFGQLREQAYQNQGRNPVQVDHLLSFIDGELAQPGTAQQTTAKLLELKKQIVTNAVPTKAGTYTRAQALDQIRDLTDDLGRRNVAQEGVKAGDVPFRKLSDAMRASLHGAAPEIAELNATQHRILTGMEDRNEMLGKRTSARKDTGSSRASAAERIAQRGEDSKTAGKRTGAGGHDIERLADMGPAPMLPGASTGQPDLPYKSLLDVPRLHLAQENLQGTPGRVFSAGGNPGGFRISELPTAVANRTVYPLARRLGASEVGSQPAAVDALTRALRRRGKKKQGAESMTRGEQ